LIKGSGNLTATRACSLVALPLELKAKLHVHNKPGMKPSSHNAFWKNGVPERYVCIVLIKARLPGDSTRKYAD
jgi:hypothetical protein